jgi:hypothetical protein
MDNTNAQSFLFARFGDLALRLRNSGGCIQNDWDQLYRDGYATESELKGSINETCTRLEDLAEQVTNLSARLRKFAENYKAPEPVDSQ